MNTTEQDPKAAALEQGLAHFTGTENHYRHWTGRLVYTDGIQYLAEQAGAYWLIDAVASYQGSKQLRQPELREFQLWTLRKSPTKSRPNRAVLTCQADSDRDPVVTQVIEFTDFPLDDIKLYVEGGCLLLTSER